MRQRRTRIAQINLSRVSERAQFYSRAEGSATKLREKRCSAGSRCANRLQVIKRVSNRGHVAVLGVYVVEVRFVGVGVAVAYRFAWDHGAEAVLEGVNGRRAHAARGGCAGDDEGVHAGGCEEAGESRAEEARGEELVEDRLRLFRGYAGVDLGPACSGLQGEERWDLVDEGCGCEFVRFAVGDGGEGDGDLGSSGDPQELLDLRDRAFEVAGQWRFWICEAKGHVYDDEGGTAAEAATPTEAFYVRQSVTSRCPAPCRARPRATR